MPSAKREYKMSNDKNRLSHIKRPLMLREAEMNPDDLFKTKYGPDGLFVGFPSIYEYLKELPEDGLNIYNELIPVKGFIPLYMDVEYLTTTKDEKPFNALLELLYHYCAANFNDYFKLSSVSMSEWKQYFMISCASRFDKKVNMFKNSYHLKLMGDMDTCSDYDYVFPEDMYDGGQLPIPYVHFESQQDIKNFIDACINNWAANSTDTTIQHLYELMFLENSAEKKQSQLGIVDDSVYKSHTAGASQALRMVYNQKTWLDASSELIPLGLKDVSEEIKKRLIIFHSITAEHTRHSYEILSSRSELVQCKHLRGFDEGRKDPDTIMNKTMCKLSGVPEEEHSKAKLLLDARLGPNTMILNSDVTYKDDYVFTIQSTDKCLVCREAHPIEYASNKKYNYKLYHTPNTNDYRLFCCKEIKKGGKYKKLNPVPTGIITKWDYRHEDGVKLCVPFTSVVGNGRELEVGGTHFYEGPKGSGKTLALSKALASLPKSKSVLVLTYRVNLSNTYKADFEAYGFTHYKDYHGTEKHKQNKHRYIVQLDSIKKTVEVDPVNHKSHPDPKSGYMFNNYVEKYDYVIIDEIYSVLEHWQSKLMGENKLYAMMLFENHLRRCDYLVCLDAHLNNSMVVNTINKLRDPNKFICYKNPNAYDMSDYKVYYSEQLYMNNSEVKDINGLSEKNKFKDKILKDLEDGKKLCVMSSTATFVKELKREIEEAQKNGTLYKFKSLLYVGEGGDKAQMEKDFQNIKGVWADKSLKLILYSPTISAGISYNNDIPEEGFDKLYCYVQTGKSVPSLNTHKQMLRRVRQLVMKEIHILFNRSKDPFPFGLDQIEKVLYDQSNDIHKYLGKPELCSENQLDANMKIKYKKDRWDYNVWKENAIHRIKYENHTNFKEGLKQSLCNSPNDEIEAGYGMQWVDMTEPIKMTKEEIESSKQREENRKMLKENEEAELYTQYMELPVPSKEELEDLYQRSKAGCAQTALTQTEEMTLRRDEVLRMYRIDFTKWKEEESETAREKQKKHWKTMLRFENVHKFARQCLLREAYESGDEMNRIIEQINDTAKLYYKKALKALEIKLIKRNPTNYTQDFNSAYEQLLGLSLKDMDTPQILEALYSHKLQQFPMCFRIMSLIGVKTDTIKENVVVSTRKLYKNKAILQKLQKDCHKMFPHLKFRAYGALKDWELVIRDGLQAWQLAHPDEHILQSSNVSEAKTKRQAVISWLQQNGKLPEKYMGAFNKTDGLKVADFVKLHEPRKDGKVKVLTEPKEKNQIAYGTTVTPEILSSGNYTTSEMTTAKWDTCEERKLLGLLSKILEDTTGYVCNVKQSTEKYAPYVVKNQAFFNDLVPYQSHLLDPFNYSFLD